ncbi:hypothetical protein ABOM_004338 [Aspergillus bombycis]|uniref:C6 finger domain protein n=1 Tax=Aspergillus bombycis TaxID=109264 RepID=A0A1F8A7I9_9EURO|nr:hypothetical protein ABOM_004338 [Aspergillus bombycis]OGM47651.1 hypothetical protein ABOM_004338 [Aspergillus bombycis]
MAQTRRKPVPNKHMQPHPPAPAHLRGNQPRAAPQMQYRPQHHNGSSPQLAHLRNQQNVQGRQIARNSAQINQHSAALQHQAANQHRQSNAQQKQMAKQNAQMQQQMAKSNAAMQKQMAKQNAAMKQQNARMGHELQAMKRQQQQQQKQGNKKKVLAGAAAGAAVGAGGAMLVEEWYEERWIHEQVQREEREESDDEESDGGQDQYSSESEHSNGGGYWPEENTQETRGNSGDDDGCKVGLQTRRDGSMGERGLDEAESKEGLVPVKAGPTGLVLVMEDNGCPRMILANIPHPAPLPQPSYNGYETLRVKYNFDVTDLASFTDVDLGKIAYLSLRDQPARLVSLLHKRSSSFLSYLPSRYGSNQCLDDAIHCVAARAGQMLGFPTRASTLPALYVKALNSLQAAIEDKTQYLEADVYCATRLLAIYELIGLPDANHWIHHNRGGIKLVELRGPENHKSEFDWLLLRSQGPSIVRPLLSLRVLVDEMYRKQASIFEDLGWQRFFAHASKAETDADSSLWWEFFGAISFMPGILRDMRVLFSNTLGHSQYLAKSWNILERTNKMHTTLHESHIRYQQRPPYPPSLFDLPVCAESTVRVRLRGFLLYVIMYISRVTATLSPDEAECAVSEAEAQAFATQALLTEKMTAQLDPTMTWHLEQRNALAHSIIQTRDKWASPLPYRLPWEERKCYLAQRWLEWEDSWRDGVLTVELEEA